MLKLMNLLTLLREECVALLDVYYNLYPNMHFALYIYTSLGVGGRTWSPALIFAVQFITAATLILWLSR